MLARIESFYLACLRIIALVAATIALVIFIFACVQGVPLLLDQLGVRNNGASDQASLAEFVTEQRPDQPVSAENGATDQSKPAPTPKIREAADSLAHYAKSRGLEIDTSELTNVLMTRRAQVKEGHEGEYEDSLVKLMHELDASTGTPLDVDHLNALLNWHLTKFQATVEEREAAKAGDQVKAGASLLIGGISLLSFILIVFLFIFVKIERNLRLVRTQEVAGAGL